MAALLGIKPRAYAGQAYMLSLHHRAKWGAFRELNPIH